MGNMTKPNSNDCNERRVGAIRRHLAMQDDTGQAFVELALALPIFILLLVGVAEFGMLAYAGIEISNAARAGVAYGAQTATTAADIAGMESAATNDGSNVAGLSAKATQFWSCSNAPSTQFSTPPTTCSAGHVLDYVQVNTTATMSPPFHYPGLPATYTLKGHAVMRVIQ
jgi:Flp pilus assembly protein TadG